MRVTCVVDDAVQRSSPYWGEHGVAFLIESGGVRHLFDTGQSGTVLLRNLKLLEVDPSSLEGVIISHGHYDHTGGLEALMEFLQPRTSLYASPDVFRKRYAIHDGEMEDVGTSLGREMLAARLSLRLQRDAQEVMPGLWTTGEIEDRPEMEGVSLHHRMREDGELVQDRYLDDMGVVLERDDGMALICGCCHAGLLNTVAHVEEIFERPVEVIAGGLHLTGASAEELEHVCEVLTRKDALTRVYPNHCTGEAAYVALTNALGPEVVRPCPVGTVLEY